ncbi:hypothetical protein ACFWXK_38680 [Streptomyces sp. NPDC059070]|uniref:hypothetical protein n=1 Tax=Streptomyces sp. NPDC059070 TaxID=3346713 RepID=UPI0036B9504B
MSEMAECRASRLGGVWVSHLPEHGVYGYGQTLTAVCEDTRQALALIGVEADVTVTPVSAEPEKLSTARQASTTAVAETVTSPARDDVTRGDISTAAYAPPQQVRQILRGQTPAA